MSWVGIIVLVLALYFAYKVVNFVIKSGLVLIALAAGYWFAAPYLNLPLPF
jgi:hypothetical protein